MNISLTKEKLILIILSLLLSFQFIIAGGNNEEQDIEEISETEILIEESIDKNDFMDKKINIFSYPIFDTDQRMCYNNNQIINFPSQSDLFFGQDAQYASIMANYVDNKDGTITDNVTKLVWTKEVSKETMSIEDAKEYASNLDTGGINNWRLPTVKELWSIRNTISKTASFDTNYFLLPKDDSQYTFTSDNYISNLNQNLFYAINNLTGIIELINSKAYVRCVSNVSSLNNNFIDNKDGTISDKATGLMWSKEDSKTALTWEEALAYANDSNLSGFDDWRLPNLNELISLLDYSNNSNALDYSYFNLSSYNKKTNSMNSQLYWTSTTNNNKELSNEELNFSEAWSISFNLYNKKDKINNLKINPISDDKLNKNYVLLVREGNVNLIDENLAQNAAQRTMNPNEENTTLGDNKGRMGTPPPNASERPPQQGPDFSSAAKILGISEEDLIEAFGDPQLGQPDFNAIAETLGISVEELLEALGMDSNSALNPIPNRT
ncbi:MAG: DUF1566 domain-containing protein [Pleomorphochaeta sp.]